MSIFTYFKGYKNEYRQNLALALPIVASHLGQVIVQFADNAMVGRLGAKPLAAVSFSGAIFFLFFLVGIGISMGLTPLVGEAFAKGRHRSSAAYLKHSIGLFFASSLVLLGILYAFVPFMGRMGQDPTILPMALGYYKYVIWSVVPFMLFAAFKQFLEGVGNTKVAMTIVLGSNALNILLNWLLIYGKWGFPEMGAPGAGLATLISRILMPVAIILYLLTHQSLRRYFSFFPQATERWAHRISLLKVGSPIASQMFLEMGAFAFISVMMGWIGAVELAANQIAITLVNCTFMIVLGVSGATTIRISHELGRGNLRALRRAANASYHLGLAWNFVTAILFVSLRWWLPTLFTSDAQAIAVAAGLLFYAAIFQMPDGFQNISLGILRGIQQTRITMVVALVSYWIVNVPLSYFLAFTLGWGPGGLWAGFIGGLVVAGVLLNGRYRRVYRELRGIGTTP